MNTSSIRICFPAVPQLFLHPEPTHTTFRSRVFPSKYQFHLWKLPKETKVTTVKEMVFISTYSHTGSTRQKRPVFIQTQFSIIIQHARTWNLKEKGSLLVRHQLSSTKRQKTLPVLSDSLYVLC